MFKIKVVTTMTDWLSEFDACLVTGDPGTSSIFFLPVFYLYGTGRYLPVPSTHHAHRIFQFRQIRISQTQPHAIPRIFRWYIQAFQYVTASDSRCSSNSRALHIHQEEIREGSRHTPQVRWLVNPSLLIIPFHLLRCACMI